MVLLSTKARSPFTWNNRENKGISTANKNSRLAADRWQTA